MCNHTNTHEHKEVTDHLIGIRAGELDYQIDEEVTLVCDDCGAEYLGGGLWLIKPAQQDNSDVEAF